MQKHFRYPSQEKADTPSPPSQDQPVNHLAPVRHCTPETSKLAVVGAPLQDTGILVGIHILCANHLALDVAASVNSLGDTVPTLVMDEGPVDAHVPVGGGGTCRGGGERRSSSHAKGYWRSLRVPGGLVTVSAWCFSCRGRVPERRPSMKGADLPGRELNRIEMWRFVNHCRN